VTVSTSKQEHQRAAGILLHPTSLPGPYGIGDLGPAAYVWVDALACARQKIWQVLPLGPTGYGDSPYQCFSSFAGNPNLISPEVLVEDGLLAAADLDGGQFPEDRVDYGSVIVFKARLLAQAWEKFHSGAAPDLHLPFQEFRERQQAWLEDFGLFMALKEAQPGSSWPEWQREFVFREPAALARAHRDLANRVGLEQFKQFLFFRQWGRLKAHANTKGIQLVGDLPIFVAGDSVDVWAHPELFALDDQRRPAVVAGVPPDYFSHTGQLWGNPLYNWHALKETGYAWWVARLRALRQLVDWIRLDHFRGFEAYWEIPADMPTAEVGRWVPGPGADLFDTVRAALGHLPLLAEDLGLITPEVEALRERLGLPGMRILQFAFGGATETRFLPHNYERNTVVYTGTHDNDTTNGWFQSLGEHERSFFKRYVCRSGPDVAWDLMRLAWASVADWALAPLQDVLGLGNEARMNRPGQLGGNWTWRFRAEMLTESLLERLADMTAVYGR
jgi:4-alpha-glucanotransferase